MGLAGRGRCTMLLVVFVAVLVSGCGTGGLHSLVLEGPDLHPSLVTQRIEDVEYLHVRRTVLRDNPQLSSDTEFVEAVARGGSQGRLDSEGIRAALYALYRGDEELGFYGIETSSAAHAAWRESRAREIWAHNASLDRASVHRAGNVVLVIWHDGVSSDCWEAVNAIVAERLGSTTEPEFTVRQE